MQIKEVGRLERYHDILKHGLYQKMLQSLAEFEIERKFCRHTLEHFCDVARIMYILSLEEQSDLEQDLIYATALLHDIGRAKEYEEGIPHDKAGQEIAKEILADTGYDATEIAMIVEAIGGHRKEDGQESELASYLYRADKLSRNCFCCKAAKECYWDDSKKNATIVL